jgi:hypothetical protein
MNLKPLIVLSLLLLLVSRASGQCMYYPVPLEQRVEKAQAIVLGHVTSKHCYFDQTTGSINTLNVFKVDAWLKNNSGASEVGIITLGGVIDDRATIAYPAAQLEDYNEYILFLEGDNFAQDHEQFRAERPDLVQSWLYADGQGALTKQFGIYHDLLVEPNMDETAMFARLQALTGQPITTPDGQPFEARPNQSGENRLMPITSFSPSPTNAGTIVPGDFITILGSGFGAAAGTVFYTNADDGGATFTSTGVASDNTAWADGSITNKVARRAGTGPINVNGAMTSGSSLTVNYAHLDINSSFSGFGVSTRQRYYHRNLNGAGGYYFLYNTTSGMSANAAAVAATERALETWRCATFINWFSNGTTATGVNGVDGLNVILFDGTLAAGVLGQAVSNFSGGSSGGCTLANTVWWVADMDIRMRTDPPVVGFPWEYGPAAPAFAEYDFESVMVHELGHAHGLGHRIATGQVMHFAISNGSSVRVLGVNDVNGGLARMAYSTAATCTNPGGSGSAMVALTAGTCVLGVNLSALTGSHVPSVGNVLHWQTHSETNNLGFMVERSVDGHTYEGLDFVPGHGTTEKSNDYSYTDASLELPVLSFYRLRQLGTDGTEGYSEVVQVRRPLAPLATVSQDALQDQLIVQFGSDLEQADFALFDLSGRKLMESRNAMGSLVVSTSQLASGTYLWRVSSGSRATTGKVMVVR